MSIASSPTHNEGNNMQKGVSVYAVEGLLEVIAALLSCVEFEGSGGSNRVLADILERSHQLGLHFLILCLLACVRSLLKAKFLFVTQYV
jgi:hypothetical protein